MYVVHFVLVPVKLTKCDKLGMMHVLHVARFGLASDGLSFV